MPRARLNVAPSNESIGCAGRDEPRQPSGVNRALRWQWTCRMNGGTARPSRRSRQRQTVYVATYLSRRSLTSFKSVEPPIRATVRAHRHESDERRHELNRARELATEVVHLQRDKKPTRTWPVCFHGVEISWSPGICARTVSPTYMSHQSRFRTTLSASSIPAGAGLDKSVSIIVIVCY